jgi:hypothetical protein
MMFDEAELGVRETTLQAFVNWTPNLEPPLEMDLPTAELYTSHLVDEGHGTSK